MTKNFLTTARRWSAAIMISALLAGGSAFPSAEPASIEKARLTILYDNTTARDGVKADWGFACLIEGMAKTILFDTGTDPAILWGNAQALGLDLGRVDAIVISHLHGDHTGGLISVLEKRPGVTVYIPAVIAVLPESTGQLTLKKISRPETTIVQVLKPVDICPGVRLTGQFIGPNLIPEVSLLLETKAGEMLITGCAHPGIVNIVRRTATWRGKPVEVVIGGFHLNQTPEPDVLRIIADMKAAGVVRCGASHCTGDPAIALFRTAFGEAFITLGVGRTIDF